MNLAFLQGDSIEAELVRHHHATSDKESNKDADDNNTSGDKLKVLPENIENEPVNAEGFEEESIDDDDIYDLTVGDVIYDVLLTLRDHPEIVKQLIASKIKYIFAFVQYQLINTKNVYCNAFCGGIFCLTEVRDIKCLLEIQVYIFFHIRVGHGPSEKWNCSSGIRLCPYNMCISFHNKSLRKAKYFSL